jgi:hypothetical protein
LLKQQLSITVYRLPTKESKQQQQTKGSLPFPFFRLQQKTEVDVLC